MQRVNVINVVLFFSTRMQSRCIGEGEIASLSANFVLGKERQTCCLGEGDRDSATWRQVQRLKSVHRGASRSVDEPYCHTLPYIAVCFFCFLQNVFSFRKGLLSTMNSKKRTPQRTGQQGPGQHPRKSNPAIVWIS